MRVLSILILIGSMNCCIPSHREQWNLNYLCYNLESESKFLPYISQAPQYHFYNGWQIEQPYYKAISRRTVIRFFMFKKRNERLVIQIEKSGLYKDEPFVSLDLYLNGYLLKELMVERTAEFRILLDKEKLEPGENFLIFNLNNKVKNRSRLHPRDFGERYTIKSIYFEGAPFSHIKSFDEEKTLIQPVNSRFRIAVNPEEVKTLLLEFKNQQRNRSKGTLDIYKTETSKKSILKHYSLSKGTLVHDSIDLQSIKSNSILTFEYESDDPRAFIIWKNIGLRKRAFTAKVESDFKSFNSKPSIFFIVIDAARKKWMNTRIKGQETTSNINRFSQIAINFDNFYSNAPYTVASVATLFSGLLPEAHTVRQLFSLLPEKVPTLPSYLKKIGYHSIALLGSHSIKATNLFKNFDTCTVIRPRKQTNPPSSYNDIDKVLKVIQTLNPQKPSFVYIHFLPPHIPYNPPKPFKCKLFQARGYPSFLINKKIRLMEKFQIIDPDFLNYLKSCYLSNLSYADYLVGRVLKAIREKGMFDSALIIVTSDHGEAFSEHAKLEHNTTLYQEMINIPFYMKLPDQKQKKICQHAHSFVDILPTLSHLLGFKGSKHWQGSVISLDRRKTKNLVYSRAVGTELNMGIIHGIHKYIFYAGRNELFNISSDPEEKQNIADKMEFLTLYLKQKLFQKLNESLTLRRILKIRPILSEKKTRHVLEELKTLGYL